jgi:hypothetical protein
VPDPLDPVAPGEVSPLVTSAATVNAVLEAARWHRGRKGAGPRGPGVADDPLTPASLVLVQNNTGSTLLAWSVCTPTGMVVDPDTDEASGHRARRRPAFVVGAPAAADDPVLITVEDIAAGKIGKAAVAGCTVAYVNRTSSAHEFAAPAAGVTTSLASAESGPVRLLAASGTGTKKFYVALGDGTGTTAALPYGQGYPTTGSELEFIYTRGAFDGTGVSVALPSPGVYVVSYQIHYYLEPLALGDIATIGACVDDGGGRVVGSAATQGPRPRNTAHDVETISHTFLYTTASAPTLEINYYVNEDLGAYDVRLIRYIGTGNPDLRTQIDYVKIA